MPSTLKHGLTDIVGNGARVWRNGAEFVALARVSVSLPEVAALRFGILL
jgi:hypothetical protein